VPRTDTYIEKESSINEQIDRMRHSATRALLERDDVIIVASVSCIYGIGSVETYSAMTFDLKKGERISTSASFIADLVALQYKRNDAGFSAAPSGCAATPSRSFPRIYEDRAWRISSSATRSSDPRVRSADRQEDRRSPRSRSTPTRTTSRRKPTLQQAIKGSSRTCSG
jgi:excinuclease ABC subunit B